jgi:tRNA A37 threonylcarbamoyladenosine synthetase subunit TsaC/SUA5/YrdC
VYHRELRHPLPPCYDERSSEDETVTTAQRMEKQFFKNFIVLIDEVQGKSKLPSQVCSYRKSAWVKQITNPRQKVDALSRV